jgi:hypothetical protein
MGPVATVLCIVAIIWCVVKSFRTFCELLGRAGLIPRVRKVPVG